MAYALNMRGIRVDQTLHGYSEGHRLIIGSLKLPTPEARTMLVLSDASASGSRIPPEGYLTGYPLAEVGKYVLARTWAAPEKSRPGCVWTHSVLIDFADLARLGSAIDLLDCFERPSPEGDFNYAARLEVAVSSAPTVVPPQYLERVGQWIAALYGRPKSRIVAERVGPGDDALVLSIWMQQWPRLRRTFRFCSFSAEDRSIPTDTFDLQLIDSGRSSRSKLPDSIDATVVKQNVWIDSLLEDLEFPAQSDLRQFLRDVGSDVTHGRAAMVPLIHLHEALAPNADPSSLTEAISALERLGAGQGRMGRAAAARAVLSRSGIDDRRLFDFAFQQFRTDPNLIGIEPAIVGRAFLRWKPEMLAEGLAKEGAVQKAIKASLLEAAPEELVNVLKGTPEATVVLLSSRPDLLQYAPFWRFATKDAFGVIGELKIDEEYAARIVFALLEAARDDFPQLVVDGFGIGPIVLALSKMDTEGIRSRKCWVQAISYRTNDLAERMVDGRLSHRPLLLVLAEILDPDAIPNSFGADPWVVALERTNSSDDLPAEDLLAAFLFNRARGLRSKSAGRLFRLSVQRLHNAMASDRLSSQAWHIAKQRLPYGSVWRDWDQCEKLRHAVVDDFVNQELPPIEFGTVVEDSRLWRDLVDLAAESWRGERYLKKVCSALEVGETGWWLERAKVIYHKLK